jgi:hypothetical protein
MYRLKSYAPFINGEDETIVLLRDVFHIGLVFILFFVEDIALDNVRLAYRFRQC